jgi:serine/threonine protein kinase
VVGERIAAGSFGAVFRAEHAESGAPAAVKIMHAELAASGEAAARFALEIAATQRVGHPGVLTVLDSGRLPDGRPRAPRDPPRDAGASGEPSSPPSGVAPASPPHRQGASWGRA